MSAAEGEEWKLYNEKCDETIDSVAHYFQEHLLFQHAREELSPKEKRYFDSLFQKAVNCLDNKYKTRNYDQVQF